MSKREEPKLSQYFVALVPPSPIYDEALQLKKYFKEQYNSKASLNSPPHITLHMPFRWRDNKENELADQLRLFFGKFRPVSITLDNFSSFPPRVIFINVINTQPLEDLQQQLQRFCKRELNLFNANYKEQPFHPHITLAFRDLKKPNYLKAWEEFGVREYKTEFKAEKVALLKHNGKVWEVFREFKLQGNAVKV
ncbi:MAG: 2'-5' RNA ligase family protein [Bacteroidota bacterium]